MVTLILCPHTRHSCGILAILDILYCICQAYNITIMAKEVTCYCDNKGALQNVYKKTYLGIMPYFFLDHDLGTIAQHLIEILPLAVTGSWIKGPYHQERNKTFAHDLNEASDYKATTYQIDQLPGFSTCPLPPPVPNYKIRLLLNNKVLTGAFSWLFRHSFHDPVLIEYIQHKINGPRVPLTP